MMKYVNFADGEQKRFLFDCKTTLNTIWKEFEKILKVNRSMIFFYLNEDCRMSYESFLCLCKISKLNKDNYKYDIVEIQNVEKEIKLPKLNDDFSEFLGILAGDGHVTDIGYEVSITGHVILDRDFMTNRVFYLFKKLFNVEPKISYQNNSIRCRTYSKKLVNFLSTEYNIPIRKKKNKLRIPLQIINNEAFLKCYLRGVFDTDGSFHRHRKNDATLEYISMSPDFLEDIKHSLEKFEMKSSISGKNLYIYKKSDIDKFFKLFKPMNIKHNRKYEIYKRYGTVPRNKEIIDILKHASVV